MSGRRACALVFVASVALAQPAQTPAHRTWKDCHYNQKHERVCRTCWIADGRVRCGQPRI